MRTKQLALRIVTVWMVGMVLPMFSAPALADRDPKGELVSRGMVHINGVGVPGTTTLVSGSRIVTGANGGAVANLWELGQIYIDTDTEMVLEYGTTGIKAQLVSGSIRIQKNVPTEVKILTQTCTRVEVLQGEVMLSTDEKALAATDSRNLLKTGELREFVKETTLFSNSTSHGVDYRVSIIRCGVGAAPIANPVFPVLWLPLLGIAPAAIVIPIKLSGGNPTSPSKP